MTISELILKDGWSKSVSNGTPDTKMDVGRTDAGGASACLFETGMSPGYYI